MSRDIILRALPWDAYHDAEWHAAYRQAARELDAEIPDPPISGYPAWTLPVSSGVVTGALKGIGKIGKMVGKVAVGAIPGIAPPVISLGDWHR